MDAKTKLVGRFDYIAYDEVAKKNQQFFKNVFTYLEQGIEMNLSDSRYKSLALTKLEEAYMYIGKAIRDGQVERAEDLALQEERSDS